MNFQMSESAKTNLVYSAAATLGVGAFLFGTKAGESLLIKTCLFFHDRMLLPDFINRWGCRKLIGGKEKGHTGDDGLLATKKAFIDDLKKRPIAEQTEAANEQHYEVDTRFFNLVLGKHQKYSSALYPENVHVNQAAEYLDEAEVRMLELYASRAKITKNDSFRIMDVGCGWGSVTLWFAENFPKCSIVGFSNSNTQREFIMGEAKKRGLLNVNVLTGDISTVDFSKNSSLVGSFDRLISIEMFEHMKNYGRLLKKISVLLKPEGYLFVHIFVSQLLPSHYVVEDESDWMTKYFFEGGTLPSDDLLLYFQDDFSIQDKWSVNGRHYSLTLEAWLQKMDSNKSAVRDLFNEYYGKGSNAVAWMARWRTFFIACSEFFNFEGGEKYYVSHYLFKRR